MGCDRLACYLEFDSELLVPGKEHIKGATWLLTLPQNSVFGLLGILRTMECHASYLAAQVCQVGWLQHHTCIFPTSLRHSFSFKLVGNLNSGKTGSLHCCRKGFWGELV